MAEISGTAGNDVFFGTAGIDNIYGAAGNDILYGNEGDDFISGGPENDLLDGGTGNDSLSGDDGEDIIYGNDGNDSLLGNNGNDKLYGGNGNDTLYGDNGNDILDGQAGSNTLIGGAGDDFYTVASQADVVYEGSGDGIDTIQSPISWRLPSQVENLTLLGTNSIGGRGNSRNNVIRGNAARNNLRGEGGNDELIGGKGRDILTGGSGADRFNFETKKDGIDRITDFSSADTIGLSRSSFDRDFRAGRAIAANQFRIGSAATRRSDRIIYDSGQGLLFFDSDGSGGASQIRLANLPKGLNLSHQNFVGL